MRLSQYFSASFSVLPLRSGTSAYLLPNMPIAIKPNKLATNKSKISAIANFFFLNVFLRWFIDLCFARLKMMLINNRYLHRLCNLFCSFSSFILLLISCLSIDTVLVSSSSIECFFSLARLTQAHYLNLLSYL